MVPVLTRFSENLTTIQSYGLGERLLKEGNQMHMAVSLLVAGNGYLTSPDHQAFYNPSPSGGIEVRMRCLLLDRS